MSPAATWSALPDARWWQQGCIFPSSLTVVTHLLVFSWDSCLVTEVFWPANWSTLFCCISVRQPGWKETFFFSLFCTELFTLDGQGIPLLGWEPHRSLQVLPAHPWPQQPTDGLGSSPRPWPGGGSGAAAAPRAARLSNPVALTQWAFTSSQLHLHMQQTFFFFLLWALFLHSLRS